MEKRKINNIDCYFHYDNRFKTICLKLHFLSPYINKDNAAKTLLLRLLFKTNKKYPRSYNTIKKDAQIKLQKRQ